MRSQLLQCLVVSSLLMLGCDKPAQKATKVPPKQAVAPKPKAKPEDAVRFMQAGRPDQAFAVASQVLLTNPTDPSALLVVSVVQRQRGQLEAARKTIDMIQLSDDPMSLVALKTKAGWMIEDGDWSSAENEFRLVLTKDPVCPVSLRSLIEILNRQGRRYEALPLLVRLMQTDQLDSQVVLSSLDPRVPMYMPQDAEQILANKKIDQSQALAIAYNMIYMQQFDEVLRVLQDHRFASHSQSAADSFAAYSAAQLEKWKVVQDRLSKIPPDNWNNVFVWIAAGMFYENSAQPDIALDCYVQALRVYNTDSEALASVARLLGQKNAIDDADYVGQQLKVAVDMKALMNEIGVSAGQDGRFQKSESIARLVKLLDETGRTAESGYWTRNYLSKSAQQTSAPKLDCYGWLPDKIVKYTSHKVPQITSLDTIDPVQIPDDRDHGESMPSAVAFAEVSQALGIDARYNNGNSPEQTEVILMHQLNAGGIGIIDYDLDGRHDFFFQLGKRVGDDSSKTASASLLRNIDATAFRNVHANACLGQSDWGMAIGVGDVDGDGFADLLSTTIGGQVLYHNLGDGSFEAHELPGLEKTKFAVSPTCAIADVTGDGLPELFIINYVDLDDVMEKGPALAKSPTNFRPSPDLLLYNRDSFVFEPVLINEEHFSAQDGRGLGIIIDNLDGIHGNDVFIANDMMANEMLISRPANDGNAPTKKYNMIDMAVAGGTAYDASGTAQASMGIATGDFNRDGRFDFFITNFLNEPNVIYTGVVGGFVDQSRKYGFTTVNKNTLGFGTQSIDLDGNGYQDIVILNGHIGRFEHVPFKMPPELYLGETGGFKVTTSKALSDYFVQPTLGRGLAYCDFDNDMRIDFVATHLDRPAAILHNRSAPSNRVQFQLVGVHTDRDATGARIHVKAGEDKWMRSMTRGSGYAASNESFLDVGLANHTLVDELTVSWPDGHQQSFSNIQANHRYLVIEDQESLVILH